MKRVLIVLLALLFSVSLFAGGAQESSADSSAKGEEKIVFEFWDSIFKTDLEANTYLRTVKEEFEKLHPDVELRITAKGRPEQEFDTLTIAFSSDNGPDAFGYSIGNLMSPFIESGKILDLTEYFEEYGWNETLSAASIEMEHQLWGDHLWSLPIEQTVMGVFYRKDLYEKYGLSVPETYEEFIHNCDVLLENGIVPIGNAGKLPAVTNRWFDALLEKNCGVELHNQILNGEASINCPEVVKSLEELKELSKYFQNGHFSAEESEVYMLLYPGKACHFYTATWQADTFENQGQDISLYGYFRFPTDQEVWRSNSFSYGVYVNKDTKYKDLAIDLLKIFASEKPYEAAFSEKRSIVGAMPSVFDASVLDPLRIDLINDINNPDGTYMPSNEMCWPPKLTDELFEVLDQVLLGTITPAEGAEQIDRMAKSINFYK